MACVRAAMARALLKNAKEDSHTLVPQAGAKTSPTQKKRAKDVKKDTFPKRPLRLNYFLMFYSLDKLFAKVPIIVIIDPPKVKFAPPCKGTTQQSQIKLTSSTTIDKNS